MTPDDGSTTNITVNVAADAALDTAGNGNTLATQSTQPVDTVEPLISSAVLSDSALKIGDTSTLTITFSEAVSGFDNSDITLAAGTLTAVSSGDGGVTWTGTFTPPHDLEDATNVITVAPTFTDLAGNAPLAGASTSNYIIDTVQPLVAITRDNTNPTNANTVVFSVDFSEDVINVDADDFVLALTGVTADSTVTVGNAGDVDASTYTVTVNVISGDGTLGLDMADSHNITDLGMNAISAAPTADEVYTIDNTSPVITAAQCVHVAEDAADTASLRIDWVSLLNDLSSVGGGSSPILHLVRHVPYRQPSPRVPNVVLSLVNILYSLSRTPLKPAVNTYFFPWIKREWRLPTRNSHFQGIEEGGSPSQWLGMQWDSRAWAISRVGRSRLPTGIASPGSMPAPATAPLRLVEPPTLLGERSHAHERVERNDVAPRFEKDQALEENPRKEKAWYIRVLEKGFAVAQLYRSAMVQVGERVEQHYLGPIYEKAKDWISTAQE